MRQRLGREQFYTSLDDEQGELNAANEPHAISDPLAELARSETIETVRRAVFELAAALIA